MSVLSKLVVASVLTVACVVALTFASCTSSPTNTHPYLRVEFVTPSIGYIAGSELLQTTDGGRTWRVVRRDGAGTFRSPLVVESLHRFQFINQEVGITLSKNVLRRTLDGGSTWGETFSIPMDHEYRPPSFFFLSEKKGWVAGKNVYYTDDGGQNWERLSATPTGDPEHQQAILISSDIADYQPVLWFNTAKDGVMVKLDGMIQLTNDGGRTWQYVFDARHHLTNVFFVDSANGWVVGYNGYVARTRDGGRTWTSIRSPTSASLFSVHFSNANSGCAVGEKCTIICTKDGGITWNFASVKSLPDTPPLLASVSFASEQHGWAVGGFGHQHSLDFSWRASKIALTTNDAGQTWHRVELPQ